MRLVLSLAAMVLGTAIAGPGRAQPVAALGSCEQAAEAAERMHGLPPGLLQAIGQIESGRQDRVSGRSRPWPWTTNADGISSWFNTREEAAAAVEALQARGVRSIDIGCFQVNLAYHPDAFASATSGFDPSVNADYAARFLVSLQRRTGDWAQAVMAYHSSTLGVGDAYWAKVRTAWGYGARPTPSPAIRVATAAEVGGVRVWTPAALGTAPDAIRLDPAEITYPRVVYLTTATAFQK